MQTWHPFHVNILDSNLLIFKMVNESETFIRDDEEWFKNRQVMNNFLLRDYHWIEDLLEVTCEHFISKIKRISDSETGTAVENLEKELYLWSSYCKCLNYLWEFALNIHAHLYWPLQRFLTSCWVLRFPNKVTECSTRRLRKCVQPLETSWSRVLSWCRSRPSLQTNGTWRFGKILKVQQKSL